MARCKCRELAAKLWSIRRVLLLWPLRLLPRFREVYLRQFRELLLASAAHLLLADPHNMMLMAKSPKRRNTPGISKCMRNPVLAPAVAVGPPEDVPTGPAGPAGPAGEMKK